MFIRQIIERISSGDIRIPAFQRGYPQKFLLDQGLDRRDINTLANICFLTRHDNNHIKAKAPSEYAQEIPAHKRAEYLAEALVPVDFNNDDYEAFRVNRAALLEEMAEALMA